MITNIENHLLFGYLSMLACCPAGVLPTEGLDQDVGWGMHCSWQRSLSGASMRGMPGKSSWWISSMRCAPSTGRPPSPERRLVWEREWQKSGRWSKELRCPCCWWSWACGRSCQSREARSRQRRSCSGWMSVIGRSKARSRARGCLTIASLCGTSFRASLACCIWSKKLSWSTARTPHSSQWPRCTSSLSPSRRRTRSSSCGCSVPCWMARGKATWWTRRSTRTGWQQKEVARSPRLTSLPSSKACWRSSCMNSSNLLTSTTPTPPKSSRSSGTTTPFATPRTRHGKWAWLTISRNTCRSLVTPSSTNSMMLACVNAWSLERSPVMPAAMEVWAKHFRPAGCVDEHAVQQATCWRARSCSLLSSRQLAEKQGAVPCCPAGNLLKSKVLFPAVQQGVDEPAVQQAICWKASVIPCYPFIYIYIYICSLYIYIYSVCI